MQRIDPNANSYSAMLWDVVTNAHRYTPKAGDWVLDLGAHFGVFSLFCASRGATVMAYEPIRENFLELQHSVDVAREIGAGEINAINRAVWDKMAIIPMWRWKQKPCFSALSRGPVGEGALDSVSMYQAEAMAIKDVISTVQWACIKMDIEGAEHRVLMNCHKFKQIDFLTVEIHNDILSLDECDDIDALLRDSFGRVDRLPVKKNPTQTVAYFCTGGK